MTQGTGPFVAVLQTVVLLGCIASVTFLGDSGVIDAAAVTAVIGAIVGSIGVLAGVGMVRRNGGPNGENRAPTRTPQTKGGQV